ncbi:MAG: di-trans,poly-cis-decaprenylcistransferase [Neisseriales bacterium]|nr:MAG: di-trans,poly-cis-decaprenylcistransferase [Neisseriales bacterium]
MPDHHVHLPEHIAIIMDGNGRWAKQHHLPRIAGYKKGLDAVRQIIVASVELGISCLTLFAFSTENWRRPPEEVSWLMDVFLQSLEQEAAKLSQHNIRLRIIGRRDHFSAETIRTASKAEAMTCANTGLQLTIAVDYGGRWDILQAVNQLLNQGLRQVDEAMLSHRLSLADLPEPDLFIRTGGEQRISNFLLWHLTYSELYFTPLLWPDFDRKALEAAITSYTQRERRFGCTSEQLLSR